MYIAMLLLFLGFEKLLEKLPIKITIVTFLIFMALFHLGQPKCIKRRSRANARLQNAV
jgi:hypothetical protein